jgi:hypothetical protein
LSNSDISLSISNERHATDYFPGMPNLKLAGYFNATLCTLVIHYSDEFGFKREV